MKLPVYWIKPFYRDSEAPGQRGLTFVVATDKWRFSISPPLFEDLK